MTAFLFALGGYLAGSIPFAVLVSRILALPDPRTYGSKNIRATNALRSGSPVAALLTPGGGAGQGLVPAARPPLRFGLRRRVGRPGRLFGGRGREPVFFARRDRGGALRPGRDLVLPG